MARALAYEWVRLRTLRSTWWLSAISLLLSAGLTVAVAFGFRHQESPAALAVTWTAGSGFSPVPFAAVFGAVIGVFTFGHEYRHGAIRATFTDIPRRGRVFLAKLIVPAVWGVVVSLVALVIDWVVVRLVWGSSTTAHGFLPSPTGRLLLGFVLLTVLWTLMGVALGGLLRSVPAAIVIVFVVPLVVEPVLSAVFTLVHALHSFHRLPDFLPFAAGARMVTTDVNGTVTTGLSPLHGGLVFAAWTAVIAVLAAVRVLTRDA
jgi:ABC-2 type transport system permease protein